MAKILTISNEDINTQRAWTQSSRFRLDIKARYEPFFLDTSNELQIHPRRVKSLGSDLASFMVEEVDSLNIPSSIRGQGHVSVQARLVMPGQTWDQGNIVAEFKVRVYRDGPDVISVTEAEQVSSSVDPGEPVTLASLGGVSTVDPRLSDSRVPKQHSHVVGDISGLTSEIEAKVGDEIGSHVSELQDDIDNIVSGNNQLYASIEDYGAVADGRDCSQAINDAIQNSHHVIIPSKRYHISSPIVIPANKNLVIEGYYTPKYDCELEPVGATSAVVLRDDFEGESAVVVPGFARGVTFKNMAILGRGVGNNIHGIGLPDGDTAPGELSLRFDSIHIAGMSGSGMYGTLHVGQLYGVHISRCLGYGIELSRPTDRWNDVKVMGLYTFFNGKSGVLFDGKQAGGVEFILCRFERSGQEYQDPTNANGNFNPDEAGVRIKRGMFISFTGCSTDANTGPGWHIDGQADAAAKLGAISFVNCRAMRDGGGAQDGSSTGAGFKITGQGSDPSTPRENNFTGCSTLVGKSSDTGEGEVLSPAYGVWIDGAWQNTWQGVEPKGLTSPWYLEGNLWGNVMTYSTLSGDFMKLQPQNSHTPVAL